MKKLAFFLFIVLYTIISNGQTGKIISNKSTTKFISIRKEFNNISLSELPNLVISNMQFSDINKNNIIDGGEKCEISFTIENIGKGEARDVLINTSVPDQFLNKLIFNNKQNIGIVFPTQKINVKIPVSSTTAITQGKANFHIEAIEKNGFDAAPFDFNVSTANFKSPNVIVADAIFSTEDGGEIKPAYPVNLKVLIQNIGEGDAFDVNANFIFNNENCLMLSETDNFNIGTLKRGESSLMNFQFTTNRRYTSNEIPINIIINESNNKFAENKLLSVKLKQKLNKTEQLTIMGINQTDKNITLASLVAETDKNIPVNAEKSTDRYALVIGNEDYTNYQTNINSESNVAFARNDATIFAEYATKTLGVKKENLFLLTDATVGEMNQKIDLITKLLTKTGSNAELLFYYAGHGLPDEATKIPYLIPVDISGANPDAGIKMADVYKQFANTGAKKITIFLDACFTGGGREAGLLAARAVKIKPKNEVLSGNIVVFAATTDEQSALPYIEKQHGMFTYYLLKKLQESKGDISYEELINYVGKNVSLQSLRINYKEQDPQVNVSMDIVEQWEKWGF